MTHPIDLERNIKNLKGMFAGKFDVTEGVMTWTKNGRVPFDDMLDAATELGYTIDMDKCKALRDIEAVAAIKRYKKMRKNMSAEQKAEEAYERRAAFGPGKRVVDTLTGETFKT